MTYNQIHSLFGKRFLNLAEIGYIMHFWLIYINIPKARPESKVKRFTILLVP